MKFSNHTVIVSDYPNPGEHLLYSTRTQALVKVNRELRDVIEQFTFRTVMLRDKYAEDLNALRGMGLIVDTEQEDEEKLKSHLTQLKFDTPRAEMFLTILTTYACNFKCTYCFQESSRVMEKMERQTADETIAWLKRKIIKDGYTGLLINFYGGEPLVNRPVLEYIVGQMRPWCEQKGMRFHFMMQTNGYLMTPELIDRYLTMGLDQVRISLDGVGWEHDRYRPLRNGKGTFDVVAGNILASAEKVKIGISVSYENSDISKIEGLLDYFEKHGVLRKLGRFIFSPIHATLGPEGQPEKIRNASCMCNYDNANLIEANTRIRRLMEAKGISMKSGLSTSVCPLTRDHGGVTVDQKGNLFKCNSMLGHPELSTGHVRDCDRNSRHYEFLHLDVWRQCPQDCTYMPMCSGGCRLSSFLNYKNFKTPTCHKPYLNRMLPEYIKKEYDKLAGEKNRRKAARV